MFSSLKFNAQSFLIALLFSTCAFAQQPSSFPTDKNFFTWLWEDQTKPTLAVATEPYSLLYIASTVTLTQLSTSYDSQARTDVPRLTGESTIVGAVLGSGGPGIAVAIGQLYFDQDAGLAHARAIAFTSATHITLASLIGRERPNRKNNLSLPSGHTSSSFATASSLAYAYGPWVGVPAYLTASYIGLTRVSDGAHWFSDVVGGAALGIFWGRASALAAEKYPELMVSPYPEAGVQGLQVTLQYDFGF